MTPIQTIVSEWHHRGFSYNSEKDMRELTLELYPTLEYQEEVLNSIDFQFESLLVAIALDWDDVTTRRIESIRARIKQLTIELFDYQCFDMGLERDE